MLGVAFFIGCHWMNMLVGVIIESYSKLIAEMGTSVLVSPAETDRASSLA